MFELAFYSQVGAVSPGGCAVHPGGRAVRGRDGDGPGAGPGAHPPGRDAGSEPGGVAVRRVRRGVPALVVLFFFYYALPQTGIRLDAFWAASLGLAVNESVFAAEIFRAGIQSLPRGQLDAGRSIGLSRRDLYRFVVLPQAIAWMIPPLTNDMVGLIKNSSLASTITVEELSLRATAVVSATFRPFEVYAP